MSATTLPPPPVGVLREIRTIARMSLRDLESATGINRGRLSIIERGARPTDDEIRRIAAALVAAVRATLDDDE